MFHIVNETDKEFKLAVIKTGVLGLVPTFAEEGNEIALFDIEESLSGVAESRIENAKDGFVVKPNRTTKFFVSEQNHVTLYDTEILSSSVDGVKYDVRCGTAVSKARGLDKSEYRLPKSIVIIISKSDEEVGLENVTEDILIEKKTVVTNTEELGVKFHVFACSHSKWQSISEQVYITLPCGEKLLFGSVVKNKDGKNDNINALIRCDADGNMIVREKKQPQRNRDNGGHRSNQNRGKKGNKKGGRGKMSDVTRGLPVYDN